MLLFDVRVKNGVSTDRIFRESLSGKMMNGSMSCTVLLSWIVARSTCYTFCLRRSLASGGEITAHRLTHPGRIVLT